MTFEDLLEDPELIEQLPSEEKEVFDYWYDFMQLSEPKKPRKREFELGEGSYDELNLKKHTFASLSVVPAVIGVEEGAHALATLSIGGEVKGFGVDYISIFTNVSAPNTALSHTAIDLLPKLSIATAGFCLLRHGLKTKNPTYTGMGATGVCVLGETFIPYLTNDVSQFVDYMLPEGSILKAGLTIGLASLMLLTAYSSSELLLRTKTKISNFFDKSL